MTTYTVTAKRWPRGWELHIEGIGVTQSRSLAGAEATAREYIAFALDLDDENSFEVDVVPQLDPEVARQVHSARERVRAAARMQQEAAAEQRMVAERLRVDGFSGREIAVVLDVSPQRVSQLIGAGRSPSVPAEVAWLPPVSIEPEVDQSPAIPKARRPRALEARPTEPDADA